MAPFDYPVDPKSAEKAMHYFADFATNNQYRDIFETAVWILYGEDYNIKFDLSKRMNFFCNSCNKTMNATQALIGHNNSAQHLKNRDTKYGGNSKYAGSNNSSLASQFPKDSLEYHLLQSHIRILGIHLIEAYSLRSTQLPYYKCLLCGAHGKREAIYKHVIGDKHTDKYIRYSVDINTGTLSSEQRNALRFKLAERDGINVKGIFTVTDKALYPRKWEDEGLPKFAMKQRYKNIKTEGEFSRKKLGRYSPTSDSKPRIKQEAGPSRSIVSIKYDRDEDGSDVQGMVLQHLSRVIADTSDVNDEKKNTMETKMGVVIHRDTGVSTSNQELQVYTPWAIDRCMLKLNFIVHTSDIKGTELQGPEDVKECLGLMFSLGNLLHFTLRQMSKQSKKNTSKHEAINQKVSKMQGAVITFMASKFNKSLKNDDDCLKYVKSVWRGSKL